MKIFKLPDLGEGLQDAEIVEWHVKEGDTVALDQALLSVETAKAIVEIPSPYAGRVAKLYGQAGELVHLGGPLVGFDLADEDADSGTVVGKVQVGQQVLAEKAAAVARRMAPPPSRPCRRCALWRASSMSIWRW